MLSTTNEQKKAFLNPKTPGDAVSTPGEVDTSAEAQRESAARAREAAAEESLRAERAAAEALRGELAERAREVQTLAAEKEAQRLAAVRWAGWCRAS